MKFKIDHDLHIHTYLSSCSKDPEQNVETILKYAEKYNLKTVAVTDHFWDNLVVGCPTTWYKNQDFENLSKIKPLPISKDTNFLFGCETEMSGNLIVGVDKSHFDDFDFIIVSTTHLHMANNLLPSDKPVDNAHRAKTWTTKLEALLSCDLPFHKIGIAHLACSFINRNSIDELKAVLDLIPDQTLNALFTNAAQKGVGIEINVDDFSTKEKRCDSVLRIFNTAKECGCKFYLGSDAHHPGRLSESMEYFSLAIDALKLTEEDKFCL